MKQQKRDESQSSSKEFVEASTFLPEDDIGADDTEIQFAAGNDAPASNNRVTELRRRIEERLDSKRIALEYGYDDFDGLDDTIENLQ